MVAIKNFSMKNINIRQHWDLDRESFGKFWPAKRLKECSRKDFTRI